MGMQIPCGLVSKIPIPDFEGRSGKVGSRDDQAAVRMEADKDLGGKCAGGPYPLGLVHSSQVLGIGGGGIPEREERHQNVQPAHGAEEAILGQALLGTGILCQHSGPGRRTDQEIRKMANEERPRHGAIQTLVD